MCPASYVFKSIEKYKEKISGRTDICKTSNVIFG